VPVVLIEAPTTFEPGSFVTGRLSPVTMDSSTSECPSSTVPSTGILAPGRISSRSPTVTSAVGISTGSPSRTTTAIGGASAKRERIASFAPPRARISSQCPSSTNVVNIEVAS
jgi:hypothetical protein